MTFSLVVETYGVWFPFALWALHSIADCTTARSGASARLVRKNLHQQLSVTLAEECKNDTGFYSVETLTFLC